MELAPPGGACTRVVGLSVSTLPVFWLPPLAYAFDETRPEAVYIEAPWATSGLADGAKAGFEASFREIGALLVVFSFCVVVAGSSHAREKELFPPGGA